MRGAETAKGAKRSRKGRKDLQIVDYAFDSLFELDHVKVDEQPQFAI